MSKSIITSAIILIALIVWMLSGIFSNDHGAENSDSMKDDDRSSFQVKIEVETSIAKSITETRSIQGSLEPFKTIKISSEIDGTIKKINFQKGQFVTKEELLFEIDQRDLPQKLAAAKATLDFKKANLDASRSLLKQGFETPIANSQKASEYKIALSEYQNILKDIEHTKVKAPTDGVINSKFVEIGDYVEKNFQLADIVKLEQLKVFVFVPQQIISYLKLGSITNVILNNENIAKGEIIFISSVADPNTRTYKVELQIDNPEGVFQAGRSVTVKIPLGNVEAHFISPALLIVSESGRLGVKYIDHENIVREADVEFAKGNEDGVWVTGLPQQVNIIIQGAGFVSKGQAIPTKNIIYKESDESL